MRDVYGVNPTQFRDEIVKPRLQTLSAQLSELNWRCALKQIGPTQIALTTDELILDFRFTQRGWLARIAEIKSVKNNPTASVKTLVANYVCSPEEIDCWTNNLAALAESRIDCSINKLRRKDFGPCARFHESGLTAA